MLNLISKSQILCLLVMASLCSGETFLSTGYQQPQNNSYSTYSYQPTQSNSNYRYHPYASIQGGYQTGGYALGQMANFSQQLQNHYQNYQTQTPLYSGAYGTCRTTGFSGLRSGNCSPYSGLNQYSNQYNQASSQTYPYASSYNNTYNAYNTPNQTSVYNPYSTNFSYFQDVNNWISSALSTVGSNDSYSLYYGGDYQITYQPTQQVVYTPIYEYPQQYPQQPPAQPTPPASCDNITIACPQVPNPFNPTDPPVVITPQTQITPIPPNRLRINRGITPLESFRISEAKNCESVAKGVRHFLSPSGGKK